MIAALNFTALSGLSAVFAAVAVIMAGASGQMTKVRPRDTSAVAIGLLFTAITQTVSIGLAILAGVAL